MEDLVLAETMILRCKPGWGLYHIDFRAFTLEIIKMETVGWKTFKIFLPLLVLMPAPANCKLVIEAARSTIILISQNV